MVSADLFTESTLCNVHILQPKAERIRNRVHLSSAKLKPSDNHVASAYSSSVSQVEAEELPVQPQFTLRPTKKEKHLERRESFLRSKFVGFPPTQLQF